jgi:hypothetical protein
MDRMEVDQDLRRSSSASASGVQPSSSPSSPVAGSPATGPATSLLGKPIADPAPAGRTGAERAYNRLSDEGKALMREFNIAAYRTYAYHATKTKNVTGRTGILNTGLDPSYGGTGASQGDAEFEASSAGKVHYARKQATTEDYRRHLEGQAVFGTRRDKHPSPAEILQISLPSAVVAGEKPDPDMKAYAEAATTRSAIPWTNVRRLAPATLPGQGGPSGYAVWRAHHTRAQASLSALKSNLSPEGRAMYERHAGRPGVDEFTLLHTINNALRANAPDRFQPHSEYKLNPRVMQGQMDATGLPRLKPDT